MLAFGRLRSAGLYLRRLKSSVTPAHINPLCRAISSNAEPPTPTPNKIGSSTFPKTANRTTSAPQNAESTDGPGTNFFNEYENLVYKNRRTGLETDKQLSLLSKVGLPQHRLRKEQIDILQDHFPYKIIRGPCGSGRTMTASLILARHMAAGVIKPSEALIVVATVESAHSIAGTVKYAFEGYKLLSDVRVEIVKNINGEAPPNCVRIIDEESLLSSTVESIRQTGASSTTQTDQQPAEMPKYLPPSALPIFAFTQLESKPTDAVQFNPELGHSLAEIAETFTSWNLPEDKQLQQRFQSAELFRRFKAVLSHGPYINWLACTLPTLSPQAQQVASAIMTRMASFRFVFADDTSEAVNTLIQKVVERGSSPEKISAYPTRVVLAVRERSAHMTAFSPYPWTRGNTKMHIPIYELTNPVVSQLPFFLRGGIQWSRFNQPVVMDDALIVKGLDTVQQGLDAVYTLVKSSLHRASPRTKSIPDVVVACHSLASAVETIQHLESQGIKSVELDNGLLSPEVQAVKSFLSVVWAQSVRAAAAAASGIIPDDSSEDETLREASLIARHVFRVLVVLYKLPTYADDAKVSDLELMDHLSELVSHHFLFRRPLDNIIISASRDDHFLKARPRQRKFFRVLTAKDRKKILQESIRRGFGKHDVPNTVMGSKVPHETYPEPLLVALRKFASDLESIMSSLNEVPPGRVVSTVIEKIMSILPSEVSNAPSVQDILNLAQHFDEMLEPPATNAPDDGGIRAIRLNRFLQLTSGSYAPKKDATEPARVKVISLSQAPHALRATTVILRPPPGFRTRHGPPMTYRIIPPFIRPKHIATARLSMNGVLAYYDFLRCANIASRKVYMLQDTFTEEGATEVMSLLGMRSIDYTDLNAEHSTQVAAVADPAAAIAAERSHQAAAASSPTDNVAASRLPIPVYSQRKLDDVHVLSVGFTSIQTFLSCPLQYFYKHQMRTAARVSVATAIGSAVHTVVSVIKDEQIKAKKKGEVAKKKTKVEITQLLKHHVIEEVVSQVKEEASREGKQLTEEEVKEIVEEKVEAPDVVETIKKLEESVVDYQEEEEELVESEPELDTKTELKFSFVVNGVIIRGAWDRVDIDETTGDVEIIEYKTNLKKNRYLSKLQLLIYCLAYKKVNDKVPKKASFVAIRGKERMDYVFTDKELDAAEALLSDMVKEMKKARRFRAQPTRACATCAFSLICPSALHESDYDPIPAFPKKKTPEDGGSDQRSRSQ